MRIDTNRPLQMKRPHGVASLLMVINNEPQCYWMEWHSLWDSSHKEKMLRRIDCVTQCRMLTLHKNAQ